MLIFAAIILFYILYAIGLYKMFEKMGEPGIKGLIPFYNSYVLYGHVWETIWFWVLLIMQVADLGITAYGGASSTLTSISSLLSIAVLIIKVVFSSRLSKAFGKGLIMCLLLAFLPPIGSIILGFDGAQYREA